MSVQVRMPMSMVQACRDESLWFDVEPDLAGDLAGEPDHFLDQAGQVIDVVSGTADLVTVFVASAQVPRFVRRLFRRLRDQGPEVTTVVVRGPGGELSLRMSELDEDAVDGVAALLSDIQRPPGALGTSPVAGESGPSGSAGTA